MARKPKASAGALKNQMAFDFGFDQTLDSIDQLNRQVDQPDTDDLILLQDDKHERHDQRTEPNLDGSDSASADHGHRTADPRVAGDHIAGLEDTRPLGTGQSQETDNAGVGRLSSPVQPSVQAAERRIESPDRTASDTQPSSGSRNPDDLRDRLDAVRAKSLIPVARIEKTNYVISEGELGAGNAKVKYRNNVNAIQLVQQLANENRLATEDEKKVLVQYVGWGGIPEAFDPANEDWKKQFNELSQLLTSSEYAKARTSTLDAHYTPEHVIRSIYAGLHRMGFKGGRILEPAGGTGHFIGFMPEHIRANSTVAAIELDTISDQISRHLYPLSTHINNGFQDTAIPRNSYDAVVGNPPFGNYSLYDSQFPEFKKLSIHNYFIAKSLEALRPGGVQAFVVSRYFMDAQNTDARDYIADRAHLLGAIRLPNNTFKQNALTEVTTDIVFFQKKANPDEITDKAWVKAVEKFDADRRASYTINQYYADHPEQLLGQLQTVSSRFGPVTELVASEGANINEQLQRALEILPRDIYAPRAIDVQEAEAAAARNRPKEDVGDIAHLKIGAFFVAPSGKVAMRSFDEMGEQRYEYYEPKNARAVDRIKGMVGIRDSLRQLFRLEQSEFTEQLQLDGARESLNRHYDAFIKKFGHISSQANSLVMRDDPEWPLIHALEHNYDKGVSPEVARKNGGIPRQPSAQKADIFTKRVLNPIKEIKHVDNAKDALVVSLNETGRVDLHLMARLTKKSTHALVQDLEGMIFHNPQSDQWESKEFYLTGNVKEKLRVAELALKSDKRYEKNVEQLTLVQPADIDAVDISVQLGSSWIPADVIKQFIHDTLKVESQVSYMDSLGKWAVKIPMYGIDPTLKNVTWGTSRYSASDLIESILQNRPIQVKDEVGVGQDRRLVLNENETNAASQKADEIKQAFVDWIWQDQERREGLTRLYNDRFNTNIPTKYDGSHLTLANASQAVQLRPSQKNGIWRAIQTGGTLFDHVVGAGKTFTCVGAAMESKRMGLIKKAMMVVPNHLTLEWKDAFYKLYPDANILVADKSDFLKKNREKFFAKIAVGDWDAVIVGHSSFKKIAMPEATLNKILNEQIDDLVEAISRLRAENGDRLSIKEMEKAHKRMTEQMKKRADTGSKDKAVDFEDLGIDSLFVDEAHEFKNLFITTAQSRIAGLGNIQGSEKAFDLFVKVRHLQEKNNGRGVNFATGTPISNTIAEVFTMQRYMQYDELKRRGIAHFDAWASTFGQVVTGWELDATGVNYRINSRFAKFQNVPELTAMYRTFADVISIADLHAFAEAEGTRFPVPKLKNGKPNNVVVPRSPAQANFMGVQIQMVDEQGNKMVNAQGLNIKTWNPGSIIYRMENLPKDPRLDNPLKITNEARKAGLDFRLINPDALDFEDSKINTAVRNIFRVWEENTYRHGTQLVFCDLSTPKKVTNSDSFVNENELPPPANDSMPVDEPENTGSDDQDDDVVDAADVEINMDELLADGDSDSPNNFSVYNDIKEKLLKMGVPASEVRFIHDAKTDLQKSKLFDQMNRGEVRILLGSTAKMGAGTNVQKRLVALHNLDAPWRPSDLEQREGRIKRQGNMFYEQDPDNFEIEIFRYATEQTYDSRMWQTIEIKASGIEQFRKGDSLVRVIDDIAGEAANAADMKAAASGNPLILMQVKLATELKKAEAVFSSYNRNKHTLERRIVHLENWEGRMAGKLDGINAEIAYRDQFPVDQFKFQSPAGKTFSKDDMEEVGKVIVNAMKAAIAADKTDVSVGVYRGTKISVAAMSEGVYFTLSSPFNTDSPNNLTYQKGQGFNVSGFFSRLNNHMANLEEQKERVLQQGEMDKTELNSARVELQKPFAHMTRLEQLRQDNREVMSELKMVQADENYVSTWTPKSLEENHTSKIKMSA